MICRFCIFAFMLHFLPLCSVLLSGSESTFSHYVVMMINKFFWSPDLVSFVFMLLFHPSHSCKVFKGCARCFSRTFRHSIARWLCETHPVFQLQGMLGFFVRWHAVLLFKFWSNYTLLHHLGTTQNKSSNPAANHRAPLTPHKSETKRPKSKKSGERRLRCYWICSSSHNCGVHYSFCNTGFKRGREEKSIAYLPHLGSSFPLVSAANWRQVLICCHRNWCINPRAPSLWCRGQYGWTSLSWNK